MEEDNPGVHPMVQVEVQNERLWYQGVIHCNKLMYPRIPGGHNGGSSPGQQRVCQPGHQGPQVHDGSGELT